MGFNQKNNGGIRMIVYKYIPSDKKQVPMPKRRWRKYSWEQKEEIIKQYDVILIDYKNPWRTKPMAPDSLRDKVVKFAFAINKENFDKGMKKYNAFWDAWDKGLNNAFGKPGAKKRTKHDLLFGSTNKKKQSGKDITDMLFGDKKKPRVQKKSKKTKSKTGIDNIW